MQQIENKIIKNKKLKIRDFEIGLSESFEKVNFIFSFEPNPF